MLNASFLYDGESSGCVSDVGDGGGLTALDGGNGDDLEYDLHFFID